MIRRFTTWLVAVPLVLAAYGCSSSSSQPPTSLTASSGDAGGSCGAGTGTIQCPAVQNCAMSNCTGEVQACFGSGAGGGACGDSVACANACNCDDTCVAKCVQSDACKACAVTYQSCIENHCQSLLLACAAGGAGSVGADSGHHTCADLAKCCPTSSDRTACNELVTTNVEEYCDILYSSSCP